MPLQGANPTPSFGGFGFSCKTAWDLERLEPNTFFPVPASVVFAQRTGLDAKASRLAGEVERWLGKAGASDVKRVPVPITDTPANSVSPYDRHSQKGADIYPRCFYFVEETINPSVVRAGQTISVNPRRGSQDKKPRRSLDLAAITEQTIEVQHVFDVHLGETLVPYATLAPLQTVLPFKRSDAGLPADIERVGGVNLGALGQRMRDRWQTVSRLWEENRAAANKMDLLEQLTPSPLPLSSRRPSLSIGGLGLSRETEHAGGPAGAQHIGVVDAISAG